MSLRLEVEFLTGVYRGTSEPASRAADWPPQPDRMFSALVAAWGARGERNPERLALQWLEQQDPPAVHAAPAHHRTAPEVFVPPDDAKRSRAARTYLRVLPEQRPRQPRRFPASRPIPAQTTNGSSYPGVSLAFVWDAAPDASHLRALESLARDVVYVGHSASLTRCQFSLGGGERLAYPSSAPKRWVYPGRLRELRTAYRTNPVRPAIRPGVPVFASPPPRPPRAPGWLVLEILDRDKGPSLDLRAAAPVCRLIRNSLMAGYRRVGWGDAVPEVVSGHTPDRRPTANPHLAVVPMPFAGSEHATGRIYGFALVPPKGTHLEEIPGLVEAFQRISLFSSSTERRVLTLQGSPLGAPLRLSPCTHDRGPVLKSLSPGPYRAKSRVWATVTPIVLDRHLKNNTDREVRELVARSCRNTGLPVPDPGGISCGRHSAVSGVPAARPFRGAPPWCRWQVPRFLRSRPLTHAVIEFESPVAGPVLLGAGRFAGLGLCRAMERRR